MGIINLDDDRNDVNADDIPWTRPPLPRVEATDLLALDGDELFNYARDLQLELDAVRALLHETLAALTRANVQGDRSRTRIRDLVEALRTARADVSVLSAQLRALQDEAA